MALETNMLSIEVNRSILNTSVLDIGHTRTSLEVADI